MKAWPLNFRKMFSIGFGLLVLFGGQALAGKLIAGDGPFTSLDVKLESLAEKVGSPGVLVGIYQQGRLVHTLAWGESNSSLNIPMTRDVSFEAGSLTKHLTAIAVLRLTESGKMRLDAPIGQYVSELPEAWRAVTVSQLLTHTAGIPDYEALTGYEMYESDADRNRVLMSVESLPLDFPAGMSFKYSNTGYFVLSLAIERVTGKPFDVAMRRLVLDPAGMSRSSMAGPTGEDRAVGYKRVDDRLVAAKPTALPTTLGAGALVTNLSDWGAWQRALASNRLIGAASHARALRPTILADGSKANYGFGIIVDTLRGVDREMHTGVMQGFSTRWEYFPKSGYSFLIVANLHDARLGDLATAISHELVPGVSYSTLAPVENADKKQLAMFKAGLEEAVLEGGNYELLGPGMLDFATKANFAPLRASLKPSVSTLSKLELLRVEPESSNGVGRFVLRGHSQEGVTYWTISMKGGLMSGLNWEDD